ncbi:hypothetical protein V8E51_018522 [Hyaloscypha variabilis]
MSNSGVSTSAQQDPEKNSEKYKADRAWKFVGYPGFCEYSALDDNFLLLRRFGALNARVLLDLQLRIHQYESELYHLDQACRDDPNENDGSTRMDSLTWDVNENNDRKRRGEIVRELQPLLHKYNKHILTLAYVKELQPATGAQVQNVRNWFHNNVNAVSIEEQDYIQHKNDLFSLSRNYKTQVQRLFEAIHFLHFLRRIFRKKYSDETRFGGDHAVRWFADTVVICLGLIMLYAPMWWLEWVQEGTTQLAIITCFVFVFAIALRAISDGKPFEVLAATAAYAAVLMVFMQKQDN